jgi:hypothetical protein
MLIGAGSAALIYSLRKEIIKGKNSLFNEKNRPDSNDETLSAPAILGLTIGADVLNRLIGSFSGDKIAVTAYSQSLKIICNF